MQMARPVYFKINPYRIFLFAAAILAFFVVSGGDKSSFSDLVPAVKSSTGSPASRLSSSFICHPCNGPMVHSASLVESANGDLIAVWFGGSREGAGDVRIYQSRLKQGSRQWSDEVAILDRREAGAGLNRYIKKLGNPVLGRASDDRLWLFYVTVSAGGWSGSSISYKVSADDGHSWSGSRKLVTSPFFNVSTLVHGTPLAGVDGTLVLPVYHELLGKFSEILRIDRHGRVLSKDRVSHGKQSFQPVITALTRRRAVMLARSASPDNRHIFVSRTEDAGKTWSFPVPTILPNPDAGIALATGPDNSLFAVYNDSQIDRSNLALAVSHDLGKTWKRIYYFEREKGQRHGEEYSYPTLLRSGDEYHLVYTWRRQGIRYVTFNSAWVRQQERRQ